MGFFLKMQSCTNLNLLSTATQWVKQICQKQQQSNKKLLHHNHTKKLIIIIAILLHCASELVIMSLACRCRAITAKPGKKLAHTRETCIESLHHLCTWIWKWSARLSGCMHDFKNRFFFCLLKIPKIKFKFLLRLNAWACLCFFLFLNLGLVFMRLTFVNFFYSSRFLEAWLGFSGLSSQQHQLA